MRIALREIGGTTTRVFHEGEGPPLLLLHGGDLSADVWVRNIDELAAHHHVVAPDLLGHGATPAGDLGEGPPHLPMLAHLRGVVEAFGFEEYAIIGSSLGAHLAVLLHLADPERVVKLVLVNSASTFASDQALAAAVAGALTSGQAEAVTPCLESCRAGLERYFSSPTAIPEFLPLVRLLLAPRAEDVADRRRILQALADPTTYREHRVHGRLEDVAAPTLVTWGDRDLAASLADSREGISRLPRGELHVFEGCGHMPFLERAEVFNELVVSFLASSSNAVDKGSLWLT